MDMTRWAPAALIGGRIGLASLFLLGGLNKSLNYAATISDMERVGLNPAAILLPLVIALELGGGALVAIGRFGAPVAALALAIFTLATNAYFHNFWTMQGGIRALELSLFFKNVSIAGGLVFLAGALSRKAAP
jgi:putative oxidoreductase